LNSIYYPNTNKMEEKTININFSFITLMLETVKDIKTAHNDITEKINRLENSKH